MSVQGPQNCSIWVNVIPTLHNQADIKGHSETWCNFVCSEIDEWIKTYLIAESANHFSFVEKNVFLLGCTGCCALCERCHHTASPHRDSETLGPPSAAERHTAPAAHRSTVASRHKTLPYRWIKRRRWWISLTAIPSLRKLWLVCLLCKYYIICLGMNNS